MKVLKADAGALTNFEVLEFLRSRGAGKDPTRVLAAVAPSEFKVFDYLEQSAASTQSKECIIEFAEKCNKYSLSKKEIMNIANIRPSSMVEAYPIIAQWDVRIGESGDDLVDMVVQVLPPAQAEMESNGPVNDEDKNVDERMETS